MQQENRFLPKGNLQEEKGGNWGKERKKGKDKNGDEMEKRMWKERRMIAKGDAERIR